jgi:hypothetical protein
VSSSELWYRRLAHINYTTLPILSKMVICLPDIQVERDGVCKVCTLGKNTKGSFTSSDSRSKGILEIIHFDVCGQTMMPSLGNCVYYVLFIDDYSHKTWIYFLKEKYEVLNKFQEFKALFENLFERKIKIFRYDNGGEYTLNEFKYFYREEGIKRELTTPYNPQLNGVAERKNISIVEATKEMIHNQNLPMHLWVEASNTFVYVHNGIPHNILGNKTLKEVFNGKNPEVNHLKIFGCPMYIHIPKEKITKLEPSRRKGIFIGYNEISKAYRIYIPGKIQIEIGQDVNFNEDEALKRSRESQKDED